MMVANYTQYEGFSYLSGLQDCFHVVREVYLNEYGIELTNYARPLGWEAFPEFDFFSKCYAREGFVCPTNNVNDLREGDVLLMAVASHRVNHCALYIGENKILHHLIRKNSQIDSYTYSWKNRVVKVLRHKDREQRLCREGGQLLELLPEHLQLRLARRME